MKKKKEILKRGKGINPQFLTCVLCSCLCQIVNNHNKFILLIQVCISVY